ncbi:MAG: flavodoxin [Paramuribaculum sp.]|nr:flavodoxin [Paramuribaculum sp.]
MVKTGIFYGSNTGTTESVANKIAECLGVESTDVHNVAETAPSIVGEYGLLILGASTWGDGELQDDMADFVTGLSAMSLKDKKIALFGCGDESMEDTFCDAIGDMYDRLQQTGGIFIGKFNTDGLKFNHSKAVKDGMAVGLLTDEVNASELSEKRVKEWCDAIRQES